MIKKILIGAAVVIAGILLYALTQPDTFHVERSQVVAAAPEKILPNLVDFRRWSQWSPWENVDPSMQRSYSGETSGKGAVYEWEGDKNVGQGRMEILEATQQKVLIQLDFIKPFEGHNKAEFILEPAGQSTNVTWAMHGTNNYMGKVMSIFMNMEKMIGKPFEEGLANLKKISEMEMHSPAQTAPSPKKK